jgi:hypothetical protein
VDCGDSSGQVATSPEQLGDDWHFKLTHYRLSAGRIGCTPEGSTDVRFFLAGVCGWRATRTQSMVAVRFGANGAVCLTAASPVPQIAHQPHVAWYRAPQVTKIGPVEL